MGGLHLNMRNQKYKRLDRLQEDLFGICEAAREYNRTDSQVRGVDILSPTADVTKIVAAT